MYEFKDPMIGQRACSEREHDQFHCGIIRTSPCNAPKTGQMLFCCITLEPTYVFSVKLLCNLSFSSSQNTLFLCYLFECFIRCPARSLDLCFLKLSHWMSVYSELSSKPQPESPESFTTNISESEIENELFRINTRIQIQITGAKCLWSINGGFTDLTASCTRAFLTYLYDLITHPMSLTELSSPCLHWHLQCFYLYQVEVFVPHLSFGLQSILSPLSFIQSHSGKSFLQG